MYLVTLIKIVPTPTLWPHHQTRISIISFTTESSPEPLKIVKEASLLHMLEKQF